MSPTALVSIRFTLWTRPWAEMLPLSIEREKPEIASAMALGSISPRLHMRAASWRSSSGASCERMPVASSSFISMTMIAARSIPAVEPVVGVAARSLIVRPHSSPARRACA